MVAYEAIPEVESTRTSVMPARNSAERLSLGSNASTPTEPKEGEPADVFLQPKLYDSVVVAAFGGLRVNLAANEHLLVHPFYPFLLCLALFKIQFTLMYFLRLDMNLEEAPEGLKEGDHMTLSSASGNRLLASQIVLIAVVNVMLFSELLDSLKLLVFVLNPTTWQDIKRPNPIEMASSLKNLFHVRYVAPLAVLAMLMKLNLTYFVLVDTVSIILASKNVKDAIFDSLAIVFLIDLNEFFLKAISGVMHLDAFDNYEFQIASPKFREDFAGRFVSWCKPAKTNCLRRGFGGRKIEIVFAYTVGFLMYARQFFIVLFAMDTHRLPMARDMCDLWRWDSGQHASVLPVITWLVRYFMQAVVIFDNSHDLDKVANPDKGGFCTEDFRMMNLNDIVELTREYPGKTVVYLLILLSLTVIPQLFYVYANQYRRKLYTFDHFTEEWNMPVADPYNMAKLQAQVDRLQNELDKMKNEE